MLIVPFKSVGNLSFNDSRQEIRNKLNEEFNFGVNEFGESKDYYDYFKQSDLKIAYNEQNSVCAFEFYKYCSRVPNFNGIDLFTTPFVDLIKFFSSIDSELQISNGEFTSRLLGIGALIDFSEEDEIACADSVIIFKEGYYDEVEKRIA